LTIYNYSQKTQYEGYWTPETLAARGLVLNSNGRVVARPFPKFFNAEEVDSKEIPLLPFEVYEKMDGSLGIFFWYADDDSEKLHPVFASRGSFTSEQAVKGWELLQRLPYHDLHYGHTHLFEIIYPENRIVVDYGKEEKLVLLGIIHNGGREVPRENIEEQLGHSFELVKVYNITENWRSLKSQNEPNREGYVIRYSNGFRMKVKFEDYVRLHQIVNGTSNIAIWEVLKTGGSIEGMLEQVPDEFFDWVKSTEASLRSAHEEYLWEAHEEYFQIKGALGSDATRKELALEFVKTRFSAIMFKWLDGNSQAAAKIAWDAVRPPYAKAFSNQTLNTYDKSI
jgi:RNA ligase